MQLLAVLPREMLRSIALGLRRPLSRANRSLSQRAAPTGHAGRAGKRDQRTDGAANQQHQKASEAVAVIGS